MVLQLMALNSLIRVATRSAAHDVARLRASVAARKLWLFVTALGVDAANRNDGSLSCAPPTNDAQLLLQSLIALSTRCLSLSSSASSSARLLCNLFETAQTTAQLCVYEWLLTPPSHGNTADIGAQIDDSIALLDFLVMTSLRYHRSSSSSSTSLRLAIQVSLFVDSSLCRSLCHQSMFVENRTIYIYIYVRSRYRLLFRISFSLFSKLFDNELQVLYANALACCDLQLNNAALVCLQVCLFVWFPPFFFSVHVKKYKYHRNTRAHFDDRNINETIRRCRCDRSVRN